ncbi:MAG: hypothetical protein AAF204_03725 [Pseudomonadota bacterium]
MFNDVKVRIPVVQPVREIDAPLAYAWATVIAPFKTADDSYVLETDDGQKVIVSSDEFIL